MPFILFLDFNPKIIDKLTILKLYSSMPLFKLLILIVKKKKKFLNP